MELAFDLRGNLQPYKKVNLSLAEFEDFFVNRLPNNSRRKYIFDRYLDFVRDFSEQVSQQFTQWVDGSFVTVKEHPNDIDFVTFVDYQLLVSLVQPD